MSSPVQKLPSGLPSDWASEPDLELQEEITYDKTWPEVERRSALDRRGRPTRVWDSLLRPGKRSTGRRQSEQVGAYVDVYHRGDVALVLATFVLNILDAFLTLRWLQLGGTEGNPLMDSLLRSGDLLFLAQKCFVVGALLVVLIVHRNFGLARFGLWALFGIYAAIFVYHLFLQIFSVYH